MRPKAHPSPVEPRRSWWLATVATCLLVAAIIASVVMYRADPDGDASISVFFLGFASYPVALLLWYFIEFYLPSKYGDDLTGRLIETANWSVRPGRPLLLLPAIWAAIALVPMLVICVVLRDPTPAFVFVLLLALQVMGPLAAYILWMLVLLPLQVLAASLSRALTGQRNRVSSYAVAVSGLLLVMTGFAVAASLSGPLPAGASSDDTLTAALENVLAGDASGWAVGIARAMLAFGGLLVVGIVFAFGFDRDPHDLVRDDEHH